jgi:hypothetical protein
MEHEKFTMSNNVTSNICLCYLVNVYVYFIEMPVPS